MSNAPTQPACGFGKETTRDEILARIEWETWAAAEQRRSRVLGHEALAIAHDNARIAYEKLLEQLPPG